MADLCSWFLTADERGNPSSGLPVYCEGNRVQPLIHGATYFDALATDEKLRDGGPTVRDCSAAQPKTGPW